MSRNYYRKYEEKLSQEIISLYINDAENVRIIGILTYPKIASFLKKIFTVVKIRGYKYD